jgi:hypothetical protein
MLNKFQYKKLYHNYILIMNLFKYRKPEDTIYVDEH